MSKKSNHDRQVTAARDQFHQKTFQANFNKTLRQELAAGAQTTIAEKKANRVSLEEHARFIEIAVTNAAKKHYDEKDAKTQNKPIREWRKQYLSNATKNLIEEKNKGRAQLTTISFHFVSYKAFFLLTLCNNALQWSCRI